MELFLAAFCVVLVLGIVQNVHARLAARFEFRIETDVELSTLDELVRNEMSGPTPFQKVQGTLEHAYHRVFKRWFGPYSSSAVAMVDVLPVAGSSTVVVTGWIEEWDFGTQVVVVADPFGPAPIWAKRKLRRVAHRIEALAAEQHSKLTIETDTDGSIKGAFSAATPLEKPSSLK